MEKRKVNKAFTLIEMMIVILVLSVCSLFSFNIILNFNEEKIIIDEIVKLQFEVIMEDCADSYENEDVEIYYSHLGNVSRAQTFYIDNEAYVVSLGTGKVYKK